MAEIKFSPEAIDDLLETKKYIAEELCSEQAATNTITKIMERIRQLQDFPRSGASLSSVVGFETEYRFLSCGNYTVFYREDGERVYIVRVLYSRRDFMRILFKEPNEQ